MNYYIISSADNISSCDFFHTWNQVDGLVAAHCSSSGPPPDGTVTPLRRPRAIPVSIGFCPFVFRWEYRGDLGTRSEPETSGVLQPSDSDLM